MRVLEFLLVGVVIVMVAASAWSFGRAYEVEVSPCTSRPPIQREMNLPLLPQVAEKRSTGKSAF
jgi:hypothetical protein